MHKRQRARQAKRLTPLDRMIVLALQLQVATVEEIPAMTEAALRDRIDAKLRAMMHDKKHEYVD